MIRRLRPDRITLFIFSLIGLLAGLMVYLASIDRNVTHYQEDMASVQKLLLLDKTFDNFLLHKIEAMDYETINRRMSEFESILERFRNRPLNNEYNENLTVLVKKIAKDFSRKRELIERFKSFNAEAINTVHYLFDLRKTLLYDTTFGREVQLELDALLFDLTQYTLQLRSDSRKILQTIEATMAKARNIDSLNLHRFFETARMVTEQIRALGRIHTKASRIPLQQDITTLKEKLRFAYNRQMQIEEFFIFLLFFFTFTMLLVIWLMYRKTQATYKQLQAFMYAVENSDNTVVMTDTQRRITYVNEAFEKGSGYTREEVLGKNPNILKSGLQEEAFYHEMNKTLDAGRKWEGIFVNRHKNGSIFYEKASIVPIRIDGEPTGYLAIKLDITQLIEQQNRLKLSAAVFENAQESIIITDKESRIISVNRAFTTITGYTEDEALGKNPSLLRSGRHDSRFFEKMWEEISKTGRWHGKIYNRAKSGEIIPMWLTISSLCDEKGNLLNYIGMQTDLREIIRNQEKAEFLAFHDTLTGLPNRAYFEEHLFHVVEVAKRNDTVLGVLFIDLDRFKVINDTLGHDVGDILLRRVSDRLKRSVRKSDMLARIGGDEFVAVLESIHTPEDAAHVAEKILAALTEPVDLGVHHLNVSASIGIALFPDNGETMVDLIKNADTAMYLAKSLGKNNYQFFMPELSRQIRRRLEIEQGLNAAVLEEEFWLAYQPQYRLADGSVYGAEALLRWQSPTLGFVPPDEFIPIAEEIGKINEIGLYVYEEACRTLRRLDEAGFALESISVNLSSKQFFDRQLPDKFAGIAQKQGLERHRIVLELTERYIMDTSSYDSTILQRFHAMGFSISVDDFGTGYSSMSYLKLLPIDTIKIDKSFIDDIPDNPNDMEITKAIIALSKSLGYKVVAEGIENEAQERFLLSQSCEYGQGYLFSRPLPLEEFVGFVKAHLKRPVGKV
ncbi:EAL domain-containing protein [Hydrogenimonas sp. SS33]|uniref:EAL domain-containing protein n=1 Tax=Hydrogenimonas leucolamina TaxID=2954236 RepID=UPI00336BAF93